LLEVVFRRTIIGIFGRIEFKTTVNIYHQGDNASHARGTILSNLKDWHNCTRNGERSDYNKGYKLQLDAFLLDLGREMEFHQ
jgi:hypothetical protein